MTKGRARARELQGHTAGIVSRVLADACDLIAVISLYMVLLTAIATVKFLATSEPFELPKPDLGESAVMLLAVQIIYLTVGWSQNNRTVGKWLLGLHVVRGDGRLVSFRRGFVRAVVCTFIGGPLLLWSIVSRRNAALYDIFLDTAVIYDWPGERVEAASVVASRLDSDSSTATPSSAMLERRPSNR